MALQFTTDTTDVVVVTRTAAMDDLTTWTELAWVYLDSLSANNMCVGSKQANAGGGTGYRICNIRLSTGQLNMDVNTDTTDVACRSADSAGNRVPAGSWQFVGYRLSSLVPTLYMGSLTAAIAELAYLTQTTGTGNLVSEASYDYRLGNIPFFTTMLPGRVALLGVWNTALTVQQMRAQQFSTKPLNSPLFWCYLGMGAANAIDLTGNGNNGAVTGATVANHVPLGPPFGYDLYEQFAAAAVAGGPPPSIVPILADYYRRKKVQ